MKKTLSFLLLTLLSIELFSAPKLIAEAETNAPVRLLTSLAEFISRISPENAGNFILFSAMFTMNPQSSAVNMDHPFRCALMRSEGQPMPFPLLSVSLKKDMHSADGSIPFLGLNWKILRTEDGDSLLCPDSPQFEPYWKQLGSLRFKTRLPSEKYPLLILRLHEEAIPFSAQLIRENLKKDPVVDAVAAIMGQELKSLAWNIRFPEQGKIHSSVFAGLRKGALLSRGKYRKSFSGFHSFQGADFFTTAQIPLSSESKCRIISITDRLGISRFPQECILRSNGVFTAAWDLKRGICKSTVGLEKNAAPILENILKEDRSIRKLRSGSWQISSLYLKIRDGKAVFVSGTLPEAEAVQILEDSTPLPAVHDKSIRGIFIEPDPNGIRMEIRMNIEDFPKPSYSAGTPTG